MVMRRQLPDPPYGILNIAKPKGVTSRDVVNRVQRCLKPLKVGHAGTLDPIASGVLLICVGKATRLVPYLHRWPKSYRATFLLGQVSPSEDVESETQSLPGPLPERAVLDAAARRMHGPQMQRPPQFSARKVAGRRAYELARRGVEMELKPHAIEVHQMQIVQYEPPRCIVDVTCSSGTYVRSLGRDLAESVGSGAVMSDLVRTAIGPFSLASASSMDLDESQWADAVLPAQAAVADLPRIQLSDEEVRQLQFGRQLKNRWDIAADEVVALTPSGTLQGIVGPRAGEQSSFEWLGPLVNMVAH